MSALLKSGTILDHIWHTFDLHAVLHVLLSAEHSFHGQEAVYMAALGAWIVAPHDVELMRVAVSQAALEVCIEIERSGYSVAIKGKSDGLIFTEAFARIGKPDVLSFYEQLYYPIGGLNVITRKYGCADLAKLFSDRSRNIDKVSEVIAIYHFHAVSFRKSPAYHRPSLIKAAEILPKIWGKKSKGDGALSERNIRKTFLEHRDTAVLIYCASTIAARPFHSLLHALQNGAFSDYKAKLILFLERTKYIHDRLVPLLYANNGVGVAIEGFALKEGPFKAPLFDDWQIQIITRTFGRNAKAKGRANTKT